MKGGTMRNVLALRKKQAFFRRFEDRNAKFS